MIIGLAAIDLIALCAVMWLLLSALQIAAAIAWQAWRNRRG